MDEMSTNVAINLQDFNKVCRICLDDSKKVLSIDETCVDNIEASELLEYTLSIQVHQNHAYPQNACEDCLLELYKIYQFKKKCWDNQNVLSKVLKEFVTKTIAENSVKKSSVLVNSQSTTAKSDSVQLNISKYSLDTEESPFNVELFECQRKFDYNSYDEKAKITEDVHTFTQGADESTTLFQLLEDKQTRGSKDSSKHDAGAQNLEFILKTDSEDLECSMNSEDLKSGTKQKLLFCSANGKEELFLCTFCGKCFRVNAELKSHLSQHIGEEPNSCAICGKIFIDIETLNTHQTIHEKSVGNI